MIMKKMIYGAVIAFVALLNVGCDFLNVEEYNQPISTITENVNFTATEAIVKQFDRLYINYSQHQSYVVELLGPEENGERQAMILDLLLPNTLDGMEGEYTVGYSGTFIALGRVEVVNGATGMMSYGGCYYGKAKGGYISDEYAFLTEGKVTVSSLDGEYFITVDAKSEENSIWAYFNGPVEIIDGDTNTKQ